MPNDPPLTVKFVEPPGQKLFALVDAEEGGVEGMQQAVTEIVFVTDDVELWASVTVSVTVLEPNVA